MCGIIGIVSRDSKKYKSQVEKAVLSLKHRGPDADGIHFFNNCVLGHTRLSIIDLSTGAQPMLSPDSEIGVTFNGEIYGYKDIKKTLSDYTFQTTSDTEILIALYKKYGKNMMDKLPGMFSFAIWDEKSQALFSARDRFGEKPFYYAFGEEGEFIFSSEIKAIIATDLIRPVIDRESIIHYLRHLYVSPDKTIYKNIFTLPPAHNLTFKNGKVEINKYWELPKINEEIGLTEAVLKFKDLLDKAVSKQLVADVPVGTFLSGGLDSSTIVAVASKFKPNLETFSFGFGESINELPFAKLVADKYKTNHKELHASKYDLTDLFLEMQDIYDEPFADSSNIPTYLISKEAKKYNKVVLTGDGGDELFGGYTGWYKPLYFMSQNVFINILHIIKDALSIFYRKSRMDLYYRVKGLTYKILNKNMLYAHIKKNTYFSDNDIKKILGRDIDKETSLGGQSLGDIMKYDATNYMPGDILTKIDRAAMAVGLELRSPFLDVDFASFCLSLPSRLKINDKEDKIILRETLKNDWPKEIRNRTKQGFGAPVKEWLELPSFVELKNKYLRDKDRKIFNIFDFKQSQKIIKKDNYKTWILLTLSVWLEKHPFEIV